MVAPRLSEEHFASPEFYVLVMTDISDLANTLISKIECKQGAVRAVIFNGKVGSRICNM